MQCARKTHICIYVYIFFQVPTGSLLPPKSNQCTSIEVFRNSNMRVSQTYTPNAIGCASMRFALCMRVLVGVVILLGKCINTVWHGVAPRGSPHSRVRMQQLKINIGLRHAASATMPEATTIAQI